jgi:hypothetical protein
MSNSKEIRKGVFFFWEFFGGNPGACCFRPICHCKQVSKNWRDFFLSHNLVKHYVSTILQKEVISKKCCKKSQYVRGWESREPTQKKNYLYLFLKIHNFKIFFGRQSGFFSKNKENSPPKWPNLKKYYGILAFKFYFFTRINNIEKWVACTGFKHFDKFLFWHVTWRKCK